MNRQEAFTNWKAHQGMLAERGIVLPNVRRYLSNEEKNNFGIAMDAISFDAANGLPGPLVTDPNSAIPAMLTTMIDPEVIRTVLAPLAFAEILSESRRGDWTMDTEMFPVVEQTGEVTSYGDYANGGNAGVNMNWPQFQNYLFQTIIRYGEREVERAGLGKINYVSELQTSASDILNRFCNLIYAFGVDGLQNYGIINNPYLSAALTPATKDAGGTAWFSGNNPNASANEVYNDIVALVQQLIGQTGGALDQDDPMTLAMSPGSKVALTFTNSFGVNVTKLLSDNFPNMRVKIAPQYGVQSATNPQGNSTAGNLIQLIADRLQGQRVVFAAFSEKLRAHKIVTGLSSWEQKMTSGAWGTILRIPAAVSQMIGV